MTTPTKAKMPIINKEVKLDHGYRIDLLVNNIVIPMVIWLSGEIKTVESFMDVHSAQVLS